MVVAAHAMDPAVHPDLVGLRQPGGELGSQAALGGLVEEQLAWDCGVERPRRHGILPGVGGLHRTPEGSPVPGDALPSGRG